MDTTRTIERTIARATVNALLAAGFKLNINNGGDDDELPAFTTDRAVIEAAMFASDEDRVMVRAPADANGHSWRGWVLLIYGNGIDVISDYTVNLEVPLTPVFGMVNAIEADGTDGKATASILPFALDISDTRMIAASLAHAAKQFPDDETRLAELARLFRGL